jgi:hypothetical protein
MLQSAHIAAQPCCCVGLLQVDCFDGHGVG